MRVITRLDETCREVRDAARVIGDASLMKKMEDAQMKIKRDSEYLVQSIFHLLFPLPLATSRESVFSFYSTACGLLFPIRFFNSVMAIRLYLCLLLFFLLPLISFFFLPFNILFLFSGSFLKDQSFPLVYLFFPWVFLRNLIGRGTWAPEAEKYSLSVLNVSPSLSLYISIFSNLKGKTRKKKTFSLSFFLVLL